MTATVGSIDPMTPAAIDALLAESTAVHGWLQGDVWSWLSTTTTFELLAALPPVSDPRHRELMLTGGAALLNLRVLIRVLGLHPAVRLLPDTARPELIAIVRPQGLRVITAEDRSLAAGIVQSAPVGSAQEPPGDPAASELPLPDHLLGLLQRAAKIEHGWLAVIPGDTLPPPIGAQNPTRPEARMAAVIGTVLDSPVARLQAGQAMQRALLTATVNGLTARPFPAVLSRPGNRTLLRELIGGGLWPQAVLALG